MAVKKREIYGRLAVQLRTHDRPRIAEKLCPGAMGLYAFLVLQARGEETHGDTSELAAYESWGAPTAYRKKQAAALIKAGLVELQGDRLVVVKYLEHNDGPEEIAINKTKSKGRYDAWLARQNAGNKRVGDALPAISSSGSCSNSNSSPEDPREPTGGTEPRRFDSGTAGSERARETFEAAVAKATGAPFGLARAPFHDRDLCQAMNKHAPADVTNRADILRWLDTLIPVWVKTAEPQTITPAKLLDWLNAGRPPRSQVGKRGTGGGPRGDRQGLDGWVPPTGTDFFGGDT